MKTLALLASVLVGVAVASYDPYMNLDMDKLYRMQLLANAINDYLPNEQPMEAGDAAMDDEVPYSYWPQLEDIVPSGELDGVQSEDPKEEGDQQQVIYNDPLYSGAHLRDEEHVEHSNLHGHQSMTGGTAEGNPKAQVKSDKLPAYCNPPNPCPVGKTAAENCVENFENTAENNERLLSQQECSCDTEHMFKCPAGSKTVSTKAGGEGEADSQQQMALNKVMGELAKMEEEGQSLANNPSVSTAHKRLTLVAKKSPHFIRKRSEGSEFNPYLVGGVKRVATKKSPEDSKVPYQFQRPQYKYRDIPSF